MELWLPFPKGQITQPFGANANGSYAAAGLRGHTTFDWQALHGAIGYACADGLIYSVTNKDNPDPDRYRAVFQLVEEGDIAYEISYGHCDKILVNPNTSVLAGTQIYTVGNTGEVYSGGRRVTREERLAGSLAGTHAHCPQVRPCRRVTTTRPDKQYLYDGFGLLYRGGFYYEVIDYDNGFNGCVDPEPFFNGFLAKDAPQVRSLYKKAIILLQLEYARIKAART